MFKLGLVKLRNYAAGDEILSIPRITLCGAQALKHQSGTEMVFFCAVHRLFPKRT